MHPAKPAVSPAGDDRADHHETPEPIGSERARSVVVLGSTGSIGLQALDLIRRNPTRFRIVGLAAGGSDPETVAAQALEFGVETVSVARTDAAQRVRLALDSTARSRGHAPASALPRVLAGPDAATELVENTPADVVLNGVDGSRGLRPTLAALATGAQLALANKESLIAGAALVSREAKPGQIVPVDSEHSALAQCLQGGRSHEVDRLVLTASGGPFRGWTRDQLADVTLDQALAHPTWSMGQMITLNSATLVNKGLELIEAHLLFGIDYDHVDVVVHPQSIVHSMVTFVDGSTLAQASPPDMRLPIALGLDWPNRISGAAKPLRFDEARSWTFEPIDDTAFPAVSLARHAGRSGGCLPAIYNAANEEAVAAFAAGQTNFPSIVHTVEEVLGEAEEWRVEPVSVDEVFAAEEWARVKAREHVGTGKAN